MHTIIKIEPIKAIKLKDENIIEQLIKNMLKSQSKKLKIMNTVLKNGDKCFLNDIFIKNGNNLKCKYNNIVKYLIPIIIENSVRATSYNFI